MTIRFRAALISLSVASCGGGAPAAAAGSRCVDGAVWDGTRCVQNVAIAVLPASSSQPPIVPPSSETPSQPMSQSTSPAAQAIARVRDPRLSFLRPRSLALLATEIQQLEQLASVTADTAPDKVALLRRLAEDYCELAVGAESAGKESVAANAHKAAIRYYEALISGFATYPQVDEVQYYDALERERMGDLDGARRRYFDLIQRHPTSKYVPGAYFAFGELFAVDASRDATKIELAIQSYRKVVTSPPPDNALYGWAWLRIGDLEKQKGDDAAATDAYAHAKEFATTFAQVRGARDLLPLLPP